MVDHGSTTLYRYGCRCWECREAHAAAAREYRAAISRRRGVVVGVRCGSASMYRYGCRCAECRAAKAAA